MSSLQHNLLRGIVKHTFIIFLQQCARLLLHRVWTTMLLVAIKRVWIKLLHCLNLARNVLVQVVTAVQQVVLQLRRAIPTLLWVVRFSYLYSVLFIMIFSNLFIFIFWFGPKSRRNSYLTRCNLSSSSFFSADESWRARWIEEIKRYF